jgi:hypothetical protein
MCEESLNGGVERQLACGEGAAAAYWYSVGKSCEKGRKLRPADQFYT